MKRRDIYTVSAINGAGFHVCDASHYNVDVAETLCRAKLWQKVSRKLMSRHEWANGALLTLDKTHTFSVSKKIAIGG